MDGLEGKAGNSFMYKKTVLPCGLTVVTEEMPAYRSATVGVWANVGSADEDSGNSGVSHFIEHMLFKGTSSKSAADIAEIMDGCGGQMNAFTEKERTCFYAKVLGDHVPMTVDLLFEMLCDSAFDQTELERERMVILDEIRMYEDSPEDLIMEMFPSLLWGGCSLGRPVVGTAETVGAMTRGDMLDYMKRKYVAGNLLVSAAGNVRHEELVDLVGGHVGMLSPGVSAGRPAPVVSPPSSSVRVKDCEQAYVIIGREGYPQSDDRRYALSVVDSILGSSMSSRIFQEIRERRGLAYNIGSFTTSLEGSGLFGIYAGTSPEHLEEVASLSASIASGMRRDGPSAAELARAKEQLKGALALSLESTSWRMISLARNEFYHGRFISPEEVFDRIDAVSMEDVMSVSDSLLDVSSYSSCVLGAVPEGFSLGALI